MVFEIFKAVGSSLCVSAVRYKALFVSETLLCVLFFLYLGVLLVFET